MFRYLQMSFFRDGWRSLLPLGMSGVFFGLGCASKWICIYSGAGLAILFAWSLVSRYLEWKAAMDAGIVSVSYEMHSDAIGSDEKDINKEDIDERERLQNQDGALESGDTDGETALASREMIVGERAGSFISDLIGKFRPNALKRKAFIIKSNDGNAPEPRAMISGERASKYPQYLIGTLAFCVVFFIVVPAVIYYLSYIPHFAWQGGVTPSLVIDEQVRIYKYHAQLVDDHAFQSPWYEWPLILKPMYYYNGTAYAPQGFVATIMCMGNPAVWWAGFIAFLYVAWRWLKPRLQLKTSADAPPAMLLIAFASQFVPWMLVPRSMFIYHYFGGLPFVMLCIVYAFERIDLIKPMLSRWLMIGYMAVVLLLFVGFYPFATGVPFPRAWADAMNWLTAFRLKTWTHGRWLFY